MISWILCTQIQYTERKNWVILTLKVESLVELKFDPAKWITGEYLSQIDSTLRVKFILNLKSILPSMLSQFASQWWVNLTLNIESIWFLMLSQFHSQCWVNFTLNVCVNLTLNVESIWLKYCPVTHWKRVEF